VSPVASAGCTGVDIAVNTNLELVDKFCCLGDMLGVDGDADAAVENRIRIGWNKFNQFVPLLTNKEQETQLKLAVADRTKPEVEIWRRPKK